MPPSQGQPPYAQNTSISPQSSAAPLLPPAEPQQQSSDGTVDEGAVKDIDPKTGKRRLFGFGKHKEVLDPQKNMETSGAGLLPHTQAAVNAMKQKPSDLKPQSQPIPISHPYSSAVAASPSRLRSSSPRLNSPASSEIFERNVQEPVPMSTLQGEMSPAHIPSHMMTEDHIPPALEASAQAITSEKLNPDEVEIVTSSAHQPAAEKVLESSASHADFTQLGTPPPLKHTMSESSELASSVHQLPVATEDDGASTYGQLDPNDVRRLSFISFADVVQQEHQQQAHSLGDIGSRDSLHMASFPGSLPSVQERAASPLRSPRSPGSIGGGMTTPPPGVTVNQAQEQSPSRSGSGIGSSTGQHGELTIETMRQAVRKTASGDLSGVRSAGMSPISDENSTIETRSRTNT